MNSISLARLRVFTAVLILVVANFTMIGHSSVAGANPSGVSSQGPSPLGLVAPNSSNEGQPPSFLVDAIARAVNEGVRVEIPEARSEFSTTYANPDGSISVVESGTPIWAPTPSAGWVAIDPSFCINPDGSFSPRAVNVSFSISGGGGTPDQWQPLIASTAPDRPSWLWFGQLPAPELTGQEATYAQVVPGVNIVVTATDNGFEQSFVLTAKPSGPIALPLALDGGDGATIQEGANGSYVVLDKAGKPLASAGVDTMSDSTDRPAANATVPADLVPADANSSPLGRLLDGPSAAVGTGSTSASLSPTPQSQTQLDALISLAPVDDAIVVAVPPADVLEDPSTVYPVTVDPVVTLSLSYDTYVQTGAYANSHYETASGMAVGASSSQPTARTYLTFDVSSLRSQFTSAQVTTATLGLYEYASSNGCTTTPWELRQSTTPSTSVTWNTQPTFDSLPFAQVSSARGNTGCAADWDKVDITSWFKNKIMAGTAQRPAVVVMASDETSTATRHSFYSSDANTGYDYIHQVYLRPYAPYVTITYDLAPNLPSGVQELPNHAALDSPTLSATVSDLDGGSLSAFFAVFSSGVQVYPSSGSIAGTTALSGGTSSLIVPPGWLKPGVTYTFAAYASDGQLASSSVTGPGFTIPYRKMMTLDGPSSAADNSDWGSPSSLADLTAEGFVPEAASSATTADLAAQFSAQDNTNASLFGDLGANLPVLDGSNSDNLVPDPDGVIDPLDPVDPSTIGPLEPLPSGMSADATPPVVSPSDLVGDTALGTPIADQMPMASAASWDQAGSVAETLSFGDGTNGTIDPTSPAQVSSDLQMAVTRQGAARVPIVASRALFHFSTTKVAFMCEVSVETPVPCSGGSLIDGQVKMRITVVARALVTSRTTSVTTAVTNISIPPYTKDGLPNILYPGDNVTITTTTTCRNWSMKACGSSGDSTVTRTSNLLSWEASTSLQRTSLRYTSPSLEDPNSPRKDLTGHDTQRLAWGFVDYSVQLVSPYSPPGDSWDWSTKDRAQGFIFRCDSAIEFKYRAAQKDGCIIWGLPVLTYSMSDPLVQKAAEHYNVALHHSTYPDDQTYPDTNGLLKHISPQLTRFYPLDGKKISRSRVYTWCKKGWPPDYTQGGKMQCDEYPFASTREAAWNPDTGWNFSVRPIPRLDNYWAGQYLKTFYLVNRIVDSDQFKVRVVR